MEMDDEVPHNVGCLPSSALNLASAVFAILQVLHREIALRNVSPLCMISKYIVGTFHLQYGEICK